MSVGPWTTYNKHLYDLADAVVNGLPRVLVMAWHLTTEDTTLQGILQSAYTKRIIPVVSTGNLNDLPGGLPATTYPSAWDSLCISVGAYMPSGLWYNNSNYDTDTTDLYIDVLAPGYLVMSTVPDDSYNYYISGTSASCGIAAGVVALGKARCDSLSVAQMETLLEETAYWNESTLDAAHAGHGLIDAYEFIQQVPNAGAPYDRLSASATQDFTDSIPCLIITPDSLKEAFQVLADKKTRAGTYTVVMTVDSIKSNPNYTGDGPASIRMCIKDYYENKHLQWVVLGGDEANVPVRYAFSNMQDPGASVISDYYYACLDGTWNYDADTLYGEVEDSVDLEPEVAVGRVPARNASDVSNFIAKLGAYESASMNQNRVLSIGSRMYTYADGKRFNEGLLDVFPELFEVDELYDDSSGTASLTQYFTYMNAGPAITLATGLAQHSGNIYLRHESGAQLLH